MKKFLGVSLTELMVTIGIVSVVGAGAFVGIQQLEEAQSQLQSKASQIANAELLLPLIEMEQSRHGQQVNSAQPVCLIQQVKDSEVWKNSCNNQKIDPPASGFITCRIDPEGNQVHTVIYHATASSGGKTINRLLRENIIKSPQHENCLIAKNGSLELEGGFYTTEDPVPDGYSILSKFDDLENIESRYILSKEVDSFTVDFAPDGQTLVNKIKFEGKDSLIQSGNETIVQSNDLEFETNVGRDLLEDERPVIGFVTSQLNLASGADASVYVVADRPVPEDINVSWKLGTSAGTVEIEAGDSSTQTPITINNASTSDPLILVNSDDYLLGSISKVTFDSEIDFKPNVRVLAARRTISYGGDAEPIEIFLTGQASGSTAIGVEVDNADCPDEPEDGTYTISYDSTESCEFVVNIADGKTAPQKPVKIKPEASGNVGQITLKINAASSSEYYGTVGTRAVKLSLVSDLPTISFLSNQSTAIEAASGANRHQVILLSDQKPARDLSVNIGLTAASAVCETDFEIPSQSCGATYKATFKAGRLESPFEIDVLHDDDSDDGETLQLTLSAGEYEVDDDSSHTVTINQYSVVNFEAAKLDEINEDASTVSITLNFSPAPTSDLKLYFASAATDEASFNDWSFNTHPLTVSKDSSTATLKLDIDADDDIPEGVQQIKLSFDDDKFIGEVLPGASANTIVTVLDNECLAADGLELDGWTSDSDGDKPNFYAPTDSAINDLTKGGTVQITDGFASTDRLRIKSETYTTDGNEELYSDIGYSANGNSYELDISYTKTTGVMTIDVDDGVGDDNEIYPEDLVQFFNDSVMLVTSSYTDDTARKVVFTLGTAQAWDKHEDGATHYYEFIEDNGGTESGGNNKNNDGINWIPAFEAARDMTYFGVPGYLATVTSKAENDFLADKFRIDGEPISGWLGGTNLKSKPTGISADFAWPSGLGHTDDIRNGMRWGWMDGPEKGRLFWSGLAGCSDPILASNGAIKDIFPYDTQMGGRRDEEDMDGNHCQYDFSDDTAAEWWPKKTDWPAPDDNLDYLECVEQESALNGHDHEDGNSPHQMKYGYNYSDLGTDGRVDTSKNDYRFANFGCSRDADKFHQPDWSGDKEYYLQLTGLDIGGKMWNDLKNDPDSQSVNKNKIYEIKGYYVEWGGPDDDSTFGFSGLKLSQTNTVVPYKCQVTK